MKNGRNKIPKAQSSVFPHVTQYESREYFIIDLEADVE